MVILIGLAAALVVGLVAAFVLFARRAVRSGVPVTRLGHAYYGYLHGHLTAEDLEDTRNEGRRPASARGSDESDDTAIAA